jgi:hypothetical protein
MKKIILIVITVLVIAVVAVFNVSLGLQKNDLSGISLANVEAWADNVEALAGERRAVSIPCLNVSGTCTYDCILADGTKATCTAYVKHA